MKVAELTQTRPTSFQGKVPRTSWWCWFKHTHPKFNIFQVKGLDINKGQGLITQSCQNFYQNLQSLCCNPSLGLATKAKACEGVGQVGGLGVTCHALRNVGKCEGMNPHTPK
jgi:hypothetical protein